VIAFEEAQRRVVAACAVLEAETVPLREAVGRVLAAPVRARADLVPFARSAMDGFAVIAADVARSAELPVRDAVFAGSGAAAHEPGTATPIATGAAIPAGADAVVRIEDVARNNGSVVVGAPVAAGEHVFPPGEDARAGDLILAAGRRIGAADAGLLAAAGHVDVAVTRRPRVAVVTTGDEIVDPRLEPGHGRIRNSNAVTIAATAAAWGCDVVLQLHAADDAAKLRDALAASLHACDLLITSGGASVGERDLVKATLKEIGCTFAFESVALRPAKPTAFATRGNVRVAVLPGNPSSAFVALHEIVRLAALSLAGASDVRLPRVAATLATGHVHGKAERTYACYAALRCASGAWEATPLENQCSALTRTASDAAGFIVVPPGSGDYAPGDAVYVDVVDWTRVGSA
jgi:molybdopterin molybdotransferase